MTTKKIAVFRKEELPEGQSRAVTLEGRELAIFHVAGEYYALADECPHIGAPLSDGVVENGKVTCPWHAWKFDVATGRCAVGEQHAEAYSVKLDGNWVVVELPADAKEVESS